MEQNANHKVNNQTLQNINQQKVKELLQEVDLNGEKKEEQKEEIK